MVTVKRLRILNTISLHTHIKGGPCKELFQNDEENDTVLSSGLSMWAY